VRFQRRSQRQIFLTEDHRDHQGRNRIEAKPALPTQAVAHCRFLNVDEDENRRDKERTVTSKSAVTGGQFKLTSLCDLCDLLLKNLSSRPSVSSSHQQQEREAEHHCADKERHYGETHYAA
jgi:hypothetical protein